MPGPDSTSEQWTVTDGNAQKNEFTDNKAPIVKDNTGTVNIYMSPTPSVPPPTPPLEFSVPNNLGLRGISNPQDFIGRDADRQRLHELLQTDDRPTDAPTVVQLVGMAGLGKTELAIQYGRLHLEDYRGGVVWCAAATLGEDLRNWMQINLDIDSDLRELPDLKQQVAKGWKAWQRICGSQRSALVIVDDVTDYRQQVLPYLPQSKTDSSPFRFLLTGRSSFGTRIPALPLTHLQPAAALALLQRWAGAESIAADRPRAESLCHRLGYLPLGIVLVGSWLSVDPDRTLAQLIASLEREGLAAPALERDPLLDIPTAELGVRAAFAVSWAQLPSLCPSAQQLARLLSLFAPADLPWSLVEDGVQTYSQQAAQAQRRAEQRQRAQQRWWWQRLGRWLRRLLRLPAPPSPSPHVPIADPLQARGTLLQTSLLQRVESETYSLHPLLWEFFAQQWTEVDDRQGWMLAFVTALSHRASAIAGRLSWDQAAPLMPLRPHLEAAQAILDTWDTTQSNKSLASALRHALLNLDQPVLVERTLRAARDANDKAKRYAAQGQTQLANDEFRYALEKCRQAVDQARQAFPATSPQLAGYLHTLANLLYDWGDYPAGVAPAEEAFTIIQAHASPLKQATYLNDLAQLYYAMGRYGEAEPLYRRSLAICEQQLGADHPHTATALNNLAELYRAMGRYGEAEPLYARSLAIREQQLGADHPHTATALNNLAGLYESMGRYGEAEPLYRRSLAICEQQLGADHPDTATALNNLAGLYESMGRYGEAEPLYARSLAIREQQLGADHPDTAASLNNLAGLYESMGRYGEAEPLYRRSLAICEQQLGADHPHTATALNNLAELYRAMGRYGEAEPLYARSLAIWEQQLGADHPDTASSLNNLALLYRTMGRTGEAEPLYRRSLAICEQQLGADHPHTASSLNNLAALYESMGRYDEAEPLYRRSLAIHEQQLGADHPDTATSLNGLAGLYYAMGRTGEAEPLFARCLGIALQALGQDHPNTQTFLNNFVTCLQAAVAAGQAGALSDHALTQAILAQLATDD